MEKKYEKIIKYLNTFKIALNIFINLIIFNFIKHSNYKFIKYLFFKII